MTAAVQSAREPDGPAVQDPVGTLLEDLQHDWDASCVLESRCGRVISHALLPDAPPAAVQAVLGRTARPLHAAQGPSRSSRTGPGTSSVTTTFPGWAGVVTVVPVQRLGWLWLAHQHPLPEGELLAGVERLGDVLTNVVSAATDVQLLDELHGRGWPPPTVRPGTVLVVCRSLTGSLPAVELHRLLSRALLGTPVRITATSGVAYLVLGGGEPQLVVERALQRVEVELGRPLAAVLAPVADDLPRARWAAETALDGRAVAGRCLTLADCRPYLTLPRLFAALDEDALPGPDPLDGLDHAATATLLAWLDRFGDVSAAAADLGVHVNTVRYRLKQVTSTVPVDLQDPVARLDLHLRLSRARSRSGG